MLILNTNVYSDANVPGLPSTSQNLVYLSIPPECRAKEQKIIGLQVTAVQGGRLFGAHAGIFRLVQRYL